jgi:hypothetical protein
VGGDLEAQVPLDGDPARFTYRKDDLVGVSRKARGGAQKEKDAKDTPKETASGNHHGAHYILIFWKELWRK